MPWTWTETDDGRIALYDHTPAESPTMTLDIPGRGIVARNGVPVKPDVTAAIRDHLKAATDGYQRDALISLALDGLGERDDTGGLGAPPVDPDTPLADRPDPPRRADPRGPAPGPGGDSE